MNIENQNTQPATRETMPEYLDRLAADQIEAGLDATGADIKAAAAEIRRLETKVTYLKVAEEIAGQKIGNLAEALLSVMETELELKIEEILDNKISDALDDYDLTDHPDFGDAVESTYARVRDLLDNASVSISI
mgnify:FL=1|tara:strand:- start:142 stop:543 length:402 start_codon:yes stop_codon:yes gene_type:complete